MWGGAGYLSRRVARSRCLDGCGVSCGSWPRACHGRYDRVVAARWSVSPSSRDRDMLSASVRGGAPRSCVLSRIGSMPRGGNTSLHFTSLRMQANWPAPPRPVSELCTCRLQPTHVLTPRGRPHSRGGASSESARSLTNAGCAGPRSKATGGLAQHIPCPRASRGGLALALHSTRHGAAADWGFR